MMQINYTNICAKGSRSIIVDVTTEICVRSEPSEFPQSQEFLNLKQLIDVRVDGRAVRYMCERPLASCGSCVAPSAPSVSTRTHTRTHTEADVMLYENSSSQFIISHSPLLLLSTLLSLSSTSKWPKVIFISLAAISGELATTVFLHRHDSVLLLNDQKSYYPHAAQPTNSQPLQIEDLGSNIHDLN